MKWARPRHAPIDLLKYAGLFTWCCAAVPLLFYTWMIGVDLSPRGQTAAIFLHLAFGAAYWQEIRNLPEVGTPASRVISLAVMTGTALLIGNISEMALSGIYLLMVAGLLPWLLPLAVALAWLIAQNVLLAIQVWFIPGTSFSTAALLAGLFLGVALFAAMASVVAKRNIQARNELRKVNSELRATQALLAENTRVAERVRIARELHDLVGHHLTALTLNLEVITHLAEGKVLNHVEQAHSLAKLLLADVREVVSDMRDNERVDLAQAVQTLVEGVPEPVVHLDIQEGLGQIDPQQAQVLLRCVQEVITNSVRHARARNLWVSVEQNDAGISLIARDDGRGAESLLAGNGLAGMRERIEQLSGKLTIETSPGEGFSIAAWMPTEASA